MKLTVTDNGGATGTTSQQVTIQAPPANTPPTAAFTSSATGLAVAFDATTSVDADGTIASYAWNFGDNATGTGVTANHTYAAAGTYTVTLTATDDDGATDVATDQITVTAPPPTNQPPTASFTSSATGLQGTFNGTASTDPDGTITAYAWDFGDGATGTGVNVTHTYAAAGTFTVTLRVTDNGNATAESAKPITVTAAPTNYAADTFSRTSASGFGNADTGGAWTSSGGSATDYYTVAGGLGKLRLPAAAAQRAAYLNGVSQTDTEVNLSTSVDKLASGGGTYVTVVGRRVGTAGDADPGRRHGHHHGSGEGLAGGHHGADQLAGDRERHHGRTAGTGFDRGRRLRVRLVHKCADRRLHRRRHRRPRQNPN